MVAAVLGQEVAAPVDVDVFARFVLSGRLRYRRQRVAVDPLRRRLGSQHAPVGRQNMGQACGLFECCQEILQSLPST